MEFLTALSIVFFPLFQLLNGQVTPAQQLEREKAYDNVTKMCFLGCSPVVSLFVLVWFVMVLNLGFWPGFRLHLYLRYRFWMKKLQLTLFQERFVESYTDMYKALISISVCWLADSGTLKCLENVISFLCRWGLWMDIIRIIAGVILLSPGLM